MTLDLFFRLAALVVFIAAFFISGFYRARAERQGGALPAGRPPDQPSIPVRLLMAVLIWGTLLVSLALPEEVPWLIVVLPSGLRWLGLAAAVSALPLIWWTMRSLGNNVSASTATREGATLVTRGPYRFVRHPLYSVGTYAFVGLALLLQSLGLMIILVPLVAWLPWRARHEEGRLLDSYGERYREYMGSTGRFLPRLGAALRRG
jgi:protein-S-isoprenylcysteine O-methyltransferase Ste14